MKRVTVCLLLVLLSCATISNGVTRKKIIDIDGNTMEYVSYR
jgi:hypothetical protein